MGCCHHPHGPHQEAPADVLPVHLDGGNEGPGVGCRRLSPDDPAPLGAWWVGGCKRSPAARESQHGSCPCLSCSWLCVPSTPALPTGTREQPSISSGRGGLSVAGQRLPCTVVLWLGVSISRPGCATSPAALSAPALPLPAEASAGSRMVPPRLRMNIPAMTMLVQSRPLPPPLGPLRGGGA